MTWYSPAQVARLVASGEPTVRATKKRHGSISGWASQPAASTTAVRSAAGAGEDARVHAQQHGQRGRRLELLIAQDAVRWGSLLG